LTLAAAVGLAVLLGLGVWQLQRLAWKTNLLARIAALKHAPARAAIPTLDQAAQGAPVDYIRIKVHCAPITSPGPATYRYALRGGHVGWRLMGFCALPGAPYAGIVLDRGLVDRFTGRMSPVTAAFPAPVEAVGILRSPGKPSFLDTPPNTIAGGAVMLQSVTQASLDAIARRAGAAGAAPYYLAVESETPAPHGVTPAALPGDIPNNHFVYALTWFGLAGVLVWMWAAYVGRWAVER
jgi:surfeit locus 1 family protein